MYGKFDVNIASHVTNMVDLYFPISHRHLSLKVLSLKVITLLFPFDFGTWLWIAYSSLSILDIIRISPTEKKNAADISLLIC